MPDLPREKLKLLFNDILLGYSSSFYKGAPVIIRHLTHFDVADFDLRNQEYYEEARSKGAPTIEERENLLIEEGSWSQDKNKQIRDNQFFLTNLRETRAKLFRTAELEQINKTIKETEEKIRALEDERAFLLQCTAESYASKRISEYQIFKSFYKGDKQYFNEDDFDSLSDAELSEIVAIYNDKLGNFNERNFKRIALSNFFLNSFYLCKDNPFTFYGKAVVQLTFFQLEVFGHGIHFKHIISSSPNKPPESVMGDPDLLIQWHSGLRNIQEQTSKGKKPEDLVGLTSKDKELYGIKGGDDIHKKMLEAAKRKGAPLSANEIMRVQGVR